MRGSKEKEEPTADEVEDYLEDAERKWTLSRTAWAEYGAERDEDEKEKKRVRAISLDDMANLAFKKYSEAKNSLRERRGMDGDIILVDNVLHSIWSSVDVMMNGELISTMNQKYMYKSYFETVLINSYLTKKYQLKSSGYYRAKRNKDEDYICTWNKGMEERSMIFRNGNKVDLMRFILSDIIGIEASIVNGMEISIMLIPNMEIIHLQTFRNKKMVDLS